MWKLVKRIEKRQRKMPKTSKKFVSMTVRLTNQTMIIFLEYQV